MGYMEHGMWEILDVLRRRHRGEGLRAIARVTGRSRTTVKRYAEEAAALGWEAGSREPDETLAGAVWERLRPGPDADTPTGGEAILVAHKERLQAWLVPQDERERGLTLTKVHRLLDGQGVRVSYSALYRFATKHFDLGRRPGTVRVADVKPGELAEVDFGRLGLVRDPETNLRRVLYALVVVLVYSRHMYVHLTHSQTLKDFVEGIENAWAFFGGVAARLVLDNLKAAVIQPDRYNPFFQRTFEEYALHRGFVIDSAMAYHAKGKPHVERQVPFVRESFFRGESFLSREHAQSDVLRWCLTTAGLRIHGTTRKVPLAEFEQVEKPALLPLQTDPFDTPRWAEPLVHPDCHVKFKHALYSVPYRHKGKKTTVRGDSKLVRIYVGGILVQTHPVQPPGGRHTEYSDYPPEKSAYAMRDPNYLIDNGMERGLHIGTFLKELLAGTFPWAKLRQAQKLLRIADKYGNQRADEACARALLFEAINVFRVQNLLEQALEKTQQPSQEPRGKLVAAPLRFLRDPKAFNHLPHKETDDDGNQDLP